MSPAIARGPHVDDSFAGPANFDASLQSGESHMARRFHSLAVIAWTPAGREDVNPEKYFNVHMYLLCLNLIDSGKEKGLFNLKLFELYKFFCC